MNAFTIRNYQPLPVSVKHNGKIHTIGKEAVLETNDEGLADAFRALPPTISGTGRDRKSHPVVNVVVQEVASPNEVRQEAVAPKIKTNVGIQSTLEEKLEFVNCRLNEDTQNLEEATAKRAQLAANVIGSSKDTGKTNKELTALDGKIAELQASVDAAPAILEEIKRRIVTKDQKKIDAIKAEALKKQKRQLVIVQNLSKKLCQEQAVAAETQVKLDNEWSKYGEFRQKSGTELPLLFVTTGSPLVISLSEIITPEVEKNVSYRSAETWQAALVRAGIR